MTKTSKWLWGIFTVLFVFFLFILLIIFSLISGSDTEDVDYGTGGTIALVELKEPIVQSESIVRQLKRFRENSEVKAIVLRIESPGGSVSASQEIYEEVKKTRESRTPIVVSMGSVAASGGYYAAIGANRIVANPGTITGSIGVISQFVHVNELLAKLGIEESTIKSGPLKDAGSPFRKMTAADRAYFQEMVNDIYDQFVAAVAKERHLKPSYVRTLADGRVFTGRKAYALKLIDTLGTYEDAIDIAASLAKIGGTPHLIREKKRERLTDMIFGGLNEGITNAVRDVMTRPVVQYFYTQPQ